ncbi:MAG: hypothetical protein LBN22_03975 [Clostridiales Family XIII bacterium]|nr:hypothetical protein [Clostridiales Family XIII bacterium]
MKNKQVARQKYDQINAIKDDVLIISKELGIDVDVIQDVKESVFNNPEFTPSDLQANAWLRIYDGEAGKLDLLFLQHEIIEMDLVLQDGMDYSSAHAIENEFKDK